MEPVTKSIDSACGPGEACDMRGRPIYPGDLLKTPHFIGARRKRYYLYHTVILDTGHAFLEMVPTSHLQPGKAKDGGRCRISQRRAIYSEIIHGHGPGDTLSFEDRQRFTKEEIAGIYEIIEREREDDN